MAWNIRSCPNNGSEYMEHCYEILADGIGRKEEKNSNISTILKNTTLYFIIFTKLLT